MGLEQNIQTADNVLSTELAAFRKHLTTLHISVMGYVAVILIAVGCLVMHNVHSYDALLDKADARYALLQKDMKDMQAQYESDVKQREGNDKQVQVIVKQVDSTNKKADQAIQTVTAPDRTQEQVSKDAQTYLGVVPTVTDGLFGFHAPAVQGFVATKIDDDRKTVDNQSLTSELTLERSSKDSLSKDLSGCQTSLKTSQDVINRYARAARKSKWRKALDTVEKVGGFVAGVYIGRHL